MVGARCAGTQAWGGAGAGGEKRPPCAYFGRGPSFVVFRAGRGPRFSGRKQNEGKKLSSEPKRAKKSAGRQFRGAGASGGMH